MHARRETPAVCRATTDTGIMKQDFAALHAPTSELTKQVTSANGNFRGVVCASGSLGCQRRSHSQSTGCWHLSAIAEGSDTLSLRNSGLKTISNMFLDLVT